MSCKKFPNLTVMVISGGMICYRTISQTGFTFSLRGKLNTNRENAEEIVNCLRCVHATFSKLAEMRNILRHASPINNVRLMEREMKKSVIFNRVCYIFFNYCSSVLHRSSSPAGYLKTQSGCDSQLEKSVPSWKESWCHLKALSCPQIDSAIN